MTISLPTSGSDSKIAQSGRLILTGLVLFLAMTVSFARAEVIFSYSFENVNPSNPFGSSIHFGGATLAGPAAIESGELVAGFLPNGTNWLAGVRAYYIGKPNAESALPLLRLSFKIRAEFGSSGQTSATVRVRIFGADTSENENALTKDFLVTTSDQTFSTTLDSWSGQNFDATRPATTIYFDFGGAFGENPWPISGTGPEGLKLILDDIIYETLEPEVPRVGRNFFVKPDGDDRASGADEDSALATIGRAALLARSGDTVIVMDGTYVESVNILRSGTPDAWITFRAQNRHQAKVTHPTDDCFKVGSAEAQRLSYIHIEGFDVMAPGEYGKGISAAHGAHHIRASHNYAHDCGESGISMADGDYFHIENNITARNGWLMYFAGSGITIWGLQKADDLPGYHSIVRNNISFANDNGPTTAMTDGNGIIIDDLMNTQGGHSGSPVYQPNYTNARTLVEGNLCFGNGGKGIQVFFSKDVDVRNNTCYRNNQRDDDQGATWRGELNASFSTAVHFANNVAVTSTVGNSVARFNTAILAGHGGYAPPNTYTYSRNITYDLANPGSPSIKSDNISIEVLPSDGNLLGVNPELRSPTLALADLEELADLALYFGLLPSSPARDVGGPLSPEAFSFDLAGRPRLAGDSVDLGAFEFASREYWRGTKLGTTLDSGMAADSEDPDNDGLSNGLEYAFALDPLSPSVGPQLVAADSGGGFELLFLRPRSELNYSILTSTDLQGWDPATVSWTPTGAVLPPLVFPETRRFWRVLVVPQ